MVGCRRNSPTTPTPTPSISEPPTGIFANAKEVELFFNMGELERNLISEYSEKFVNKFINTKSISIESTSEESAYIGGSYGFLINTDDIRGFGKVSGSSKLELSNKIEGTLSIKNDNLLGYLTSSANIVANSSYMFDDKAWELVKDETLKDDSLKEGQLSLSGKNIGADLYLANGNLYYDLSRKENFDFINDIFNLDFIDFNKIDPNGYRNYILSAFNKFYLSFFDESKLDIPAFVNYLNENLPDGTISNAVSNLLDKANEKMNEEAIENIKYLIELFNVKTYVFFGGDYNFGLQININGTKQLEDIYQYFKYQLESRFSIDLANYLSEYFSLYGIDINQFSFNIDIAFGTNGNIYLGTNHNIFEVVHQVISPTVIDGEFRTAGENVTKLSLGDKDISDKIPNLDGYQLINLNS